MHEFAVMLFGTWEIVDRLGTKSRTCSTELALCDPINTLTYHSTFYMRFVPRGNSEERVAGGKNETAEASNASS